MDTKMKVEIYGAGCDKFFRTVKSFRYAVQKIDIACEVKEITDGRAIASRGLVNLPAVFVNGNLILQGEEVGQEKARELMLKAV